MAWTNLSFAYGSTLTSSQMTQMYDNFAAMAAGSAGAPVLTAANASFASGAAAVTQAVGNNTTLLATTAFVQAAEFVDNDLNASSAIGVVAYLKLNGQSLSVANLATVSGSSLLQPYQNQQSAGTLVGASGVAMAGTWRNITSATITTDVSNLYAFGLFQRIS